MKLSSEKHGKYLVITLTGILKGQMDLSNIKEFKTQLAETAPLSEPHLILDLEKVVYIDSAVIGVFADLLNTRKSTTGSFGLVNVNKKVMNILELVNLTKFFPIYRDIDSIPKE